MMNYSRYYNYITFHNDCRSFMKAGYFVIYEASYATCYYSTGGNLIYILDSGKIIAK